MFQKPPSSSKIRIFWSIVLLEDKKKQKLKKLEKKPVLVGDHITFSPVFCGEMPQLAKREIWSGCLAYGALMVTCLA